MVRLLKQNIKIFLQRLFATLARNVDVETETGPSLVIAPHPDDESLGCGAVIARLCAKGRRVCIVIVTDGAIPNNPDPKAIGAARRKEAQAAARALGVSDDDIAFLNFPDEGADRQVPAIETALKQQIDAVKPGQIFSPYGVDGHSDHRAIAEAIDKLYNAGAITCPVYEYPIWFWTRGALDHMLRPYKLLRLRRVPTAPYLETKKAAIAAHHSQYSQASKDVGSFTFPGGFVELFVAPYELFFEKVRRKSLD